MPQLAMVSLWGPAISVIVLSGWIFSSHPTTIPSAKYNQWSNPEIIVMFCNGDAWCQCAPKIHIIGRIFVCTQPRWLQRQQRWHKGTLHVFGVHKRKRGWDGMGVEIVANGVPAIDGPYVHCYFFIGIKFKKYAWWACFQPSNLMKMCYLHNAMVLKTVDSLELTLNQSKMELDSFKSRVK